jgi:hypothetical protein
MAALVLVACTSTTAVNGQNAPLERCESATCFDQRRIRDFEVVDSTTLIVYVGEQKCPFLVSLTGTFCDITFLPGFDVAFGPTTARELRQPTLGRSSGRVDLTYARVCANDLGMGLVEGPFTSSDGDPGQQRGLDCRIQDIESLTDDEILEVYVETHGVAPPPPFGTGRVSAPDNAEEPESSSASSPGSSPD